MNNKISSGISYHTITQIRERKAILKKEIETDNNKIQAMWHILFNKPTALNSKATPSQRLNSLFSTSAGVFDAFMLGWKLYKKFKR